MMCTSISGEDLERIERIEQELKLLGLYRSALERLRDQHSAPVSPGPCIVCSIVYGTLAEADRRARQHDH